MNSPKPDWFRIITYTIVVIACAAFWLTVGEIFRRYGL